MTCNIMTWPLHSLLYTLFHIGSSGCSHQQLAQTFPQVWGNFGGKGEGGGTITNNRNPLGDIERLRGKEGGGPGGQDKGGGTLEGTTRRFL